MTSVQKTSGLRIQSRAWKWRGDKLLMQYRVIRPNGDPLTDWGAWPTWETVAKLRREIAAMDSGLATRGNPCKRGHNVRYINNGNCVECTHQTGKNRYEKLRQKST